MALPDRMRVVPIRRPATFKSQETVDRYKENRHLYAKIALNAEELCTQELQDRDISHTIWHGTMEPDQLHSILQASSHETDATTPRHPLRYVQNLIIVNISLPRKVELEDYDIERIHTFFQVKKSFESIIQVPPPQCQTEDEISSKNDWYRAVFCRATLKQESIARLGKPDGLLSWIDIRVRSYREDPFTTPDDVNKFLCEWLQEHQRLRTGNRWPSLEVGPSWLLLRFLTLLNQNSPYYLDKLLCDLMYQPEADKKAEKAARTYSRDFSIVIYLIDNWFLVRKERQQNQSHSWNETLPNKIRRMQATLACMYHLFYHWPLDLAAPVNMRPLCVGAKLLSQDEFDNSIQLENLQIEESHRKVIEDLWTWFTGPKIIRQVLLAFELSQYETITADETLWSQSLKQIAFSLRLLWPFPGEETP
ncbi:hypothetical protein N7468_007613 [Penicillium chermesinum]|uniref:Uncharacterized protein n=1 Tax=Penicillium chermesinum TaxID=63820 RepID=A0A9W9NWS3_9EURO|nr:uncharacterized protein N7468_007613 [Penicillium chermesinum]KAJ5226388.1 hypothetical protein N7468_007613 [Penicillium chermesinum]KAJ6160428.1 hypothetical protein N7470_003824 [Penicillium chermesinum]